jgi:regulator of protease activity HflC (stomatin/prohibitin superfamily)
MFTDKNGDITVGGGMSIAGMAVTFIGGMIVLSMWGCPQYSVYSARKEGEAVLAHAQSSREVAVAEAKAKMESASLLAQADTIRAHGIAESNQIIGKSLQGNPSYLQWLWIDQMKDTKNQVIYLPNTGELPFTEAGRMIK